MRIITFCIIIVLFPLFVFAQRYDQKWIMGNKDFAPPYNGNVVMNFTQDTMTLTNETWNANIPKTNTSLFAQNGNLLFYTNGLAIFNVNKDTMENGNGLSPSNYSISWNWFGLRIPQASIALPMSNDFFYLFHETIDINTNAGSFPLNLYYSTVNMFVNNGLGKVVAKNVSVIQDTLAPGQITACKHGNGRDWWVLVPRYTGDAYYKCLIKPNSVQVNDLQQVNIKESSNCFSQAAFSPDGTKYIRYDEGAANDTIGFINIFDFDRCTGLLSNLKRITVYNSSNSWGGAGIAISPNSSVLYLSTIYKLRQYNLNALNISATEYLVGMYDGFQSPWGSNFLSGQLAPDGKIYWNCTNSENVLHVINKPNELGAACAFGQHTIFLQAGNDGLPNHPNYYLGAKVGSTCDTLGLSNQSAVNSKQAKIYPNPANEAIVIKFSEKMASGISIELINSLGLVMAKFETEQEGDSFKFDTSHLSEGVYYIRTQIGSKIYATKFVVQH